MSSVRGRVLLVEDDLSVGAVMAERLEAADFIVDGPYCTLADGAAALADRFPDVAILDVRLRDQHAFLLADDLEIYGIPFLWCSGLDVSAAITRRFGPHPFVRKDHIEQLVPTLCSLVRKRPLPAMVER